MAAPSYTEDLTDYDLAQATGNFAQWNPIGGGGNISLGSGPDFAIQNNVAVDGKITNNHKGIACSAGTISLGAGDHIYVWCFMATPGITDQLSARGVTIGVGTNTTNAFCQYHVEGNDTYGSTGRVAKCYPIDYTTRSSNTGSIPYRTVSGSPGASPTFVAVAANITATSRGSNLAIDAIRYGTGAYLTAGELISAGDGSDNPCTFDGFNAQDDALANKWGILVSSGGAYELQGKFAIGQNNSQVATLCRFEDSSKTITIPDTVHSAADFSEFIIDHASTVCNWTNVNITALGTNNPGKFTVSSANPTVNINGGVWNGIGLTTLRSNCTIDALTWLSADQVTLNGATITNAIMSGSSAGANTGAFLGAVTDIAKITGATLSRDTVGNTGHAIEINSLDSASLAWDNTIVAGGTNEYSTGTEITNSTGTAVGNEAIYVNVGSGSLTINVADGATIPSIRSAGALITVSANKVTVDVNVKTSATGNANIENAGVHIHEVGNTSNVYISGYTDSSGNISSDPFTYASDINITGWVRQMDLSGTDYVAKEVSGTITSAGATINVQLDPI